MRVLWLCSTPGLGVELLGSPLSHGGGWEAALEGAVKRHSEVQLSLGFPWHEGAVRQIPAGQHQYLPFPRFPRGGRFSRLLADASCRLEPESELDHLERVVALARPDLIHVFGTESNFGLIGERTSIPVLVEIKGLRTQCSDAYLSEISKLDLLRFGKPKHLLNGRSQLHQYYRYRRTARREQRILAAARFVAGRTDWDQLACSVMAPEAQYYRSEEVLRPSFYQANLGGRQSSGPLRIVSTLRGNAYKGIVTLARTARLLRGLLPRGCEWSLVGLRPGDEVHRIVERKLDVSFDSLSVRPLGRLPAEEVVSQLKASDVYVHPSQIDNSPNGLCEAMLVGLPVVSTNVGGIPSLIDHEQEGLLVPPSDPWALAGAIKRLADDPDLAEQLGVAARSRAHSRHDPEAVVEELVTTYGRILARQSGQSDIVSPKP